MERFEGAYAHLPLDICNKDNVSISINLVSVKSSSRKSLG